MNSSKTKIFLFSCLAFLGGVGLASFLPPRFFSAPLWWFAGFVALAAAAFLSAKLRLVALLGAIFVFGLWRYAVALPPSGPDQVSWYNGSSQDLVGSVTNEPDDRLDQVKYEIGELVRNGQHLGGKVLVTAKLQPKFFYGERIRLSCKLKAPQAVEDFAYDRYLARYDIYSVCYNPEIVSLGEPDVAPLKVKFFRTLYGFKNLLSERLGRGLPEPSATLAIGLVLGGGRSLPAEVRDQFSRSGLSHIVAVSGLNITMIAGAVMALLLASGFKRRPAFCLASLFIAVYILAVGAPASAVRAGLASFLLLLAMESGRLSRVANALAFAAAILSLFNPKLLRDDLGFQLSFLAIIGMAVFYPRLALVFRRWTRDRLRPVTEVAAMTLAAQFLTWPILANNFSRASLVAPLANVLVIWTLPFVTAALFCGLALSLALPNLAAYLLLPARPVLAFILAATEITAGLPYAAITARPPLWLVVLFYIVFAFWLIFRNPRATIKDDIVSR